MGKKRDFDTLPGITDLNGDPGSPRAPDPLSSNDPSLGSAPTPAEAEKAVERAEAEKAGEPEKILPPKPVVPYRVFRSLSGIKVDKLAGFESHVAREEMRPCTVEEWRSRFAAFMSKPVKSLKG